MNSIEEPADYRKEGENHIQGFLCVTWIMPMLCVSKRQREQIARRLSVRKQNTLVEHLGVLQKNKKNSDVTGVCIHHGTIRSTNSSSSFTWCPVHCTHSLPKSLEDDSNESLY